MCNDSCLINSDANLDLFEDSFLSDSCLNTSATDLMSDGWNATKFYAKIRQKNESCSIILSLAWCLSSFLKAYLQPKSLIIGYTGFVRMKSSVMSIFLFISPIGHYGQC